MKRKSFLLRFFSMAAMVALQNAIVFGVNLADNVMLGAFSENAMGGVALANQIQFLLQQLVGGIGEGAAVLCSQYWGEKRVEPIRRVAGIALKCGVVLAGIFMVLAFFLPAQLLGLLSNDGSILPHGIAYFRIMGFSYLFFCGSSILIAIMRSVENTALGLKVSLGAFGVNIVLNAILIYGRLGLPAMGAEGAALATLAARMLEFFIAAVFVFRRDERLRLRLCHLKENGGELWRDFRHVAAPVIFSGGSWGIAMLIQTGILGRMDATAVKANAIATTLFQLLSVAAYATGSVSAIVIGKAVGGGDLDEVHRDTGILQRLYLVIGTVTGMAIYLLRSPVLSLYGDLTPETRSMAMTFMAVLAITSVGTAYQMPCLTGIVRGGGCPSFVFYNDLIFMWGLVLPSAILCAFVFRLEPVWVFLCLKADQILKCFVAVVVVNRYRWIRKVTK